MDFYCYRIRIGNNAGNNTLPCKGRVGMGESSGEIVLIAVLPLKGEEG